MKLRGSTLYLTVLVGAAIALLLMVATLAEPVVDIKESQTTRQNQLTEAMELLDDIKSDGAGEEIEMDDEVIPAASPFE